MTLTVMLLCWGGQLFAQQRVSGQVLDSDGAPVIGAVVIVDGTSEGTGTDIDGRFTLNVKPGTSVTVSIMGYKDAKVSLTNGMTIRMEEDTTLLEEVVVVGYGVQKKETLTGAISVVNDKALEDKGSLASPLQAMQGQIPGVIITRGSSAPGDESWSMNIRGAVSTNNSDPLVIIDGVAYDSVNDMRLLNPSDIASMSFLKDASAAIYGSRAAGGVLLITTKKGTSGRAKVEYSGSVAMKMPGLMPELMSLDEWADGVLMATNGDLSHTWNKFARLAKEYRGMYIDLDKTASPFGTSGFTDVADFVFDDNTDWFGSVFGNSWSTTHDLSVSGGSEKINYRVSLGYLYDGSPLQYGNNNNQRYNVRVNNTFNITDWMTLESVVGYNRQEQVAPTELGKALTVTVPMPGLPLFSMDGKPYAWGTWVSPAAAVEYGGDNRLSVSAFNISETLKIKFTKWLDANINFGYNSSDAIRDKVSNAVEYYNYTGTRKVLTSPTAEKSTYSQTMSRSDFYSVSGYLNGHHNFAGKHNLSVTLGGQYELKNFRKMGATAEAIQPGLEILNGSGTITIPKSDNDKYQFAIASVYGRANYDYNEKYLVELSMRYDGSSKFLPENRWAFFWGGSLGWRIAEEGFLDGADWMDELKLRVSYGQVGNQNGISNYDGIQLYNVSSASGALVGDGLLSLITTSGSLASIGRTWEKVHNYNIGLDFGFLGNRLTGSFEAFQKRNNNMLIGIDFPAVLGDNPPSANVGEFKSWGYEGMLQWRDQIGKDFSYSVGGTFTFTRNQIVNLGGQATVVNDKYVSNREGYPLRSLFGLRYAGKIENEDMLNAYLTKYYPNNEVGMPNTLRVGDNMFSDESGDGKLTADDYVYLGSDDPEIQYSVNLGVAWKGIDLSVVFQGAANRTVWNGINNWTVPMRALYTNTTNQSVGKVWSPENPTGHYTPYTTDSSVNNYNYQASTWSVSDGSYLRLKNVSLGYTLPSRVLDGKAVSGCRFYLTGTDLWEYDHILDGWDPEAKTNPSTTARYPFLRTVTFGVNLTF